MPRMRPDDAVKQRMWAALLKAAKRHHNHPADRGMVTIIAADAGVSKSAVSDWKNLGNYPEEETLIRLADIYRVSAEILSGYIEGDVLAEDFGPPDKVLTRSANLAVQIATRMIDDPGMKDLARVQRRVNELIVEGRSDHEIKGMMSDELAGDEPDDD